MTDTDRERLTTDQLAHPQGAERTTSEQTQRLGTDVEHDTSRTGAHASDTFDTDPDTGAYVGTGTSTDTDTAAGASTGTYGDTTADTATGTAAMAEAKPHSEGQTPTQLLGSGELAAITSRWSDIQTAFVDSPQQAVQDADALVADLMQHLAQVFATERQQLEGQWSRGGTVSTEDLRVSLQRYRSFFQRLLSV